MQSIKYTSLVYSTDMIALTVEDVYDLLLCCPQLTEGALHEFICPPTPNELISLVLKILSPTIQLEGENSSKEMKRN
jgi:hypothetical protein